MCPTVFFYMLFYTVSHMEQGSLSSMVSFIETHYKSCGGDVHSRSRSGISIQYEYYLKSGAITGLNNTSGNRNDRTDA
jgi:hypothetical protein